MANGTIYYMGNKARSADAIVNICLQEFGRVDTAMDLFAGSGTVSRVFSKYMRVIANDIQMYSWKLCSASLQGELNAQKSLVKKMKSGIIEGEASKFFNYFSNEISKEKEIIDNYNISNYNPEIRLRDLADQIRSRFSHEYPIVSNYGCAYFSLRNACELQAATNFSDTLLPEEKIILDASIISAASRSTFTVGNQFAQPIKLQNKYGFVKSDSIKKYTRALMTDAVNLVFESTQMFPSKNLFSEKNLCLNTDDISALKSCAGNANFLYADPPYGREHYSRYYHVLESIAKNDYSNISDNHSRMRGERFQSPYGHRSRAKQAFSDLIASARAFSIPIAFSYVDESNGKNVENRILSLEDLREILHAHYASVTEYVVSGKTYSQFNRMNGRRDLRRGKDVLLIAK